jgi:O-antigen/teichoic acid export membrane protein
MFQSAQDYLLKMLRWSEKYTKTDMVYLARGGVLSIIGQGAALVASLGLAVAVSHFIPKDIYGTYKFVLSIVAILSLFSLTGISGAVFQSAAQGMDGALQRGFWENIKWSFGVFIAGFVLSAYYFANANSTLAVGVLIGASLSPFIASASLFGPFLGGKKDFWRQTIYGIIDNVVPILIFIGVVLFTSNPILLILTYFITNALAALFFYGRTIEIYRTSLHIHDDELVNYSRHLSAMGIVSGIAGNIDQILLFHFVGPIQLAVYNFATAIPDQMRGPAKNIDAMMQARFVNRSAKEIRNGMGNKVAWYSAFSIGFTVLYVLFAPLVFRLMFPTYIDAVWYSQIYALWTLTLAFDPFLTYMTAKRLVLEQYITTISYSVLQIGLMVLGVLTAGLLGIIIARLVARLAVVLLGYILYRRAILREEAIKT